MESLVVMLAAVVFLWVGLVLWRRWFPPVDQTWRISGRVLRWLWRERHERSGAGRPNRPGLRYKPPRRGGP
jgi:hypothetical protein